MACSRTFTGLKLYFVSHVSVLYTSLTSLHLWLKWYIFELAGRIYAPSTALIDHHSDIAANRQVEDIIINNSTVDSGFKSSGEQSETACNSPLLLLVFVQSPADTNFIFSSVVSFHVVSPTLKGTSEAPAGQIWSAPSWKERPSWRHSKGRAGLLETLIAACKFY